MTMSGGRSATEAKLFKRIRRTARLCAVRVLGDRQAAADVAQEVVLFVLVRMRYGDWDVRPKHLKAYVRWLTRRRLVDRIRRSDRLTEREAEHVREWTAGTHAWMRPDEALEARELEAFYEGVLSSLPPACRRAYELVREEEMSYIEAAARLGVTRAAVSANVKRALSRLRAALRERGIVVAPPRGSPKRMIVYEARRDPSR